MEKTEELSHTLNQSREALLAALARPDFYIEISLIAGAVAIGWLLALFIAWNIRRHLDRHPPRRIAKDNILRPLGLLGPIMAFFTLGIAKPFAQRYAEGGEWTSAMMQLMLAFLLARLAFLVIRARAMAHFISVVILIYTLLNVTGFMDSTKTALDSLDFNLGKVRLSMLTITQGLIILVIVFWVANLLSTTLESHLQRSSRLTYNTRALVVKFFRVFVYFIAFLITLGAMGIDLTALAIFSGALGVGIGLGLQKVTANFVSGVTLLMEKSIKIGDLIEMGQGTGSAATLGWVRQLNVRYALIETFDGRELLVPNDILISTQVTNWTYSSDRARVDFNVGVSYDSDLDLVKKLVMEAINEHPRVIKDPPPTCQLREFGDSALVMKVTFWIGDIREGRAGPQSDVMIAVLKKFRAHNIEIPYPHQVAIQQANGPAESPSEP